VSRRTKLHRYSITSAARASRAAGTAADAVRAVYSGVIRATHRVRSPAPLTQVRSDCVEP
jgi:hypothetical protein